MPDPKVLVRNAEVDDLSRWAADELSSVGGSADALYLATSNAGRRESVEFWRGALATGLAFANPRLFPWTLANSPTGAIAHALGAIEHPEDDLADGLVRRAVVVAVARCEDGRSRLAAALVDGALSTGCRGSLITTFVECLTSSSSRPMATSQPSR